MPENNAPLLVLNGLCKTFGTLDVLRDISLSMREGEVVGLIGASGSGKSTLLRCINRLETPASGTTRFHDKEITPDNIDLVRR